MVAHHDLKIEQVYLERILQGEKTFEIRFNDRDYQVGDTIVFKSEIQSEGPYQITYLLSYPAALKEGWVVFGIKHI